MARYLSDPVGCQPTRKGLACGYQGPHRSAARSAEPSFRVSGRRQRSVYLDVLRAVAILLVLGSHVPVPLRQQTAGLRFFRAWQTVGWSHRFRRAPLATSVQPQ